MPSHSFTSKNLVALTYDIAGAALGAHSAFKTAAAAAGFKATAVAGGTVYPLPNTCLHGEFQTHEVALRALAEAEILASAEHGAAVRLSRWSMVGPDARVTVFAEETSPMMGLGDSLGAHNRESQMQRLGLGTQLLAGSQRR